MATMKDVARLAKVSHGTVSNVLNGSKSVSSEKIKRVEQAMAELGYKPNVMARSLKTNRTGRIEVILPDILNPAYAKMFEEIDRRASENGYAAYLSVCSDVPDRECAMLERAHMMGADGVILLTCQPDNTAFFNKLADGGMPIVFVHHKVSGDRMNNVDMDVRGAIAENMRQQVAYGRERIAIVAGPQEYSYEMECVDAYFDAMRKVKRSIETNYIEIVNSNKESAMRAAIRLMELQRPPEVIYTTGRLFSEGVSCALSIAGKPEAVKPFVITLDAQDWTSEKNVMQLPYTYMARKAFDLLQDIIETQDFRGGRSISVQCATETGLKIERRQSVGARPKIRILTQNSPASHTVKTLAADFTRSTGIDFDVNQVAYSDLLTEIQRGVPAGDYDVFSFDLAWMKELALNGYMQELSDLLDIRQLQEAFCEDVLREHCVFREALVALPFSMTVQMLYYRKDLFEQLKNKRLYYEINKRELRVPQTWEEYNLVARFFTRSFNSDSETLYGTTLGAMHASGAVCEFLPRAWAEGGNIFENGKAVINSEACVKALTCYRESFDYACPESPAFWWDEQAERFARGEAAMMAMYSDHATTLEDRSISSVVGKVGCALLPGMTGVLGGWSMAVSAFTPNKKEALEFVKWTASESLMTVNAMLGRIVPYQVLFESGELHKLYPWLRMLPHAFACTKRRNMPKNAKGESVSEAVLEKIIADAVHSTLSKRLSPKDALDIAAQMLNEAIQ